MTKREIFLKVKNHLLTQMVKSMEPDSQSCAYRGQNGTKCAIGCLIPDEHYDPIIERASMTTIGTTDTKWISKISRVSSVAAGPERLADILNDLEIPVAAHALLGELQTLHDQNEPENWAALLDQLEKRYFFTSEMT